MGNHTPVDGNLQEISSSATSANAGRMAMCHPRRNEAPLFFLNPARQGAQLSTFPPPRNEGDAQDADTAPAARAHEPPAADTVRALFRRYRHPARGRCPVQAAVRPGISCHSAARRTHRRRLARIFLTRFVLYRSPYRGADDRDNRASPLFVDLVSVRILALRAPVKEPRSASPEGDDEASPQPGVVAAVVLLVHVMGEIGLQDEPTEALANQ